VLGHGLPLRGQGFQGLLAVQPQFDQQAPCCGSGASDATPTVRVRHPIAQAIRLRETLALPWREVARVMGFNTGKVLAWWHRYQAEGGSGLVSKKPGRAFLSGRILSMQQEWAVRTVVTHQTPAARGLPFALWSRRAVRDLIQAEYGIEMPIRTVGEYLKRWGFKPQRPGRQVLQ
jgi:transposase